MDSGYVESTVVERRYCKYAPTIFPAVVVVKHLFYVRTYNIRTYSAARKYLGLWGTLHT